MTQKEIVLKYMQNNGSITTLEAVNKLLILDLQGVIRQLKQEYNISSEWIKGKNIYGVSKSYKRYKLVK